MAAEPIVEPVVEPVVLWLVPDTIPLTDVPIEFPGQGPRAAWDDVWGYGKSIVKFFGRNDPGVEPVTSATLNAAIDSAIGATIKSLSGFINQAASLAVDAQNWAAQELDAMSANIGAIYHYFDQRIGKLEAFEQAALGLAFPSLQAQIDLLQHERLTDAQFNSAADRQWAVDNIYKPLHENIGDVASAIPTWSEGAYERARDFATDAVNGLGLNVLTQLVPLTVAVHALQAESEECTQPMCDVMGPKTDLGKLLKGLKLALGAAFLAELLSMNHDELAAFLQAIGGHFGELVSKFEEFFASDGETLAQLLARAGASVL